MSVSKERQSESSTIERQKRYVAEQDRRGGGLGLVFADAFLRGIRDIGYRDTCWALSEQVDNAIQADATVVDIRFGYAKRNTSKKKPDMIAVVDNGVGMIDKMISYAVRWGGTDRENDRTGFGRYGYGLPSSAVSFCTRYTVYSKVKDAEWHAVTVDIDELSQVSGDVEATNGLLMPKKRLPPAWAVEQMKHSNPGEWKSGTIVVHEKLDRPTWKTSDTLKSKLLRHLGVVYRTWLPTPKLIVDESIVDPVDPLFLMEQARYVADNPVKAEKVETDVIEVATRDKRKGRVRIRASYLPPAFQKEDPTASSRSKVDAAIWSIMKEYNGIMVCRDGRQIDCVQPRWTKFQNYDRNTKIEIDFDPELDEYFGITTSKQQIVITDEMWDRLESDGGGNIKNLVNDIRRKLKADIASGKGKKDSDEGKAATRPSEAAMQETEKFKARPDKPSDEKVARANEELENAATKISETTGKKREEVAKELEERAEIRRFEIEFQSIPEGPFYRPKRLGRQKRLIINTQHPFYEKVYSQSPQIKSALEVLLLVLAEAELEAEGDFENFYLAARQAWSERLHHALDHLTPDDIIRDIASAVAEQAEQMELEL